MSLNVKPPRQNFRNSASTMPLAAPAQAAVRLARTTKIQVRTAAVAVSAVVAGLVLSVAPAQASTTTVQNHSPFAPSVTYTGRNSEIEMRAACATPTHRDQAACFAIARQSDQGTAGAHAKTGDSATPSATPYGYGPSTLRSAYNLPTSRGSGRVVAVVDAYNDPNAESDLTTYRSTYGLPPCTTANGCFKKINQSGGTSYPSSDVGWASEISLDLDMVSAVCPNCHILLVEASSAYLSDLGKAVNEAVSLGARFVSNSYGAAESSSDITYDSQYFNHPGVAITASAGDGGYATSYPADSRYVVAVGGTSLTASSSARGWTEKVWSGSGSGCSGYDAKPTWQTDTGCAKRTGNDVSAVADPNTGVAVYDTYQSNGWQVYGGTSASAPIIAATYALAGTPLYGSSPASYLYAHQSALNDVTTGSDGTCSVSYLCTARAGYDGPTGLGTPNGITAFLSS